MSNILLVPGIVAPAEKNPEAMPDIRSQTPDLIPYLREGERIIWVESVKLTKPAKLPSSLLELHRLTQSNDGSLTAAKASLSLGSRENPAFHRYEATFGRDSLRVAFDLLDRYPELAKVTLRLLAALQGISHNDAREEEPGKIIHEDRDPLTDPIAREITAKWGWGWPYYGSVDATPAFIRTACAYITTQPDGKKFLKLKDITGLDGKKKSLADALQAAVRWTLGRMDASPEGLIEFKRLHPGGIENQAWKDSWDAYMHADGTLANPDKGIASIEVQQEAYDALMDAAEVYEDQLGLSGEAADLRQRADRLKHTILSQFWCEDHGGYFRLGFDHDEAGNLRPLEVRTSNMGHLLHSRLLESDTPETHRMRQSLIANLFSVEMLNVSGIRTLATDEALFRPGAYHNGSVWLWDTYAIARGLERHSYHGLAEELRQRIINVVNHTRQFPEYARGDDGLEPALNNRTVDIWSTEHGRVNRIEQPPQEVQAWTVAAVLAIKSHTRRMTCAEDRSKRAFEEQILASLPFRLATTSNAPAATLA